MAPNRAMVILLAVLSQGGAGTSPLSAQQAQQGVTLAQFRQLSWLEGAWRGSGGSFPAFYEEYRAVDDSTIQMRAFSDSTFLTVTDSSRIELRGGSVASRRPQRVSVAILVRPDRIHFQREGRPEAGFTFSRDSGDQWTATLHSPVAGGRETVYVMRRLRR